MDFQSDARVSNLECPHCRARRSPPGPQVHLLYVSESGWRCAECKRSGNLETCPHCDGPMWRSHNGHSPERRHCNRCHFKLERRDVSWVDVVDNAWPTSLVHEDAYLFDPNDPSNPAGMIVNSEEELATTRNEGYCFAWEARAIAQEKFERLVAGPTSDLRHYRNKHGLIARVFRERVDSAAEGGEQWQHAQDFLRSFPEVAFRSDWMKPWREGPSAMLQEPNYTGKEAATDTPQEPVAPEPPTRGDGAIQGSLSSESGQGEHAGTIAPPLISRRGRKKGRFRETADLDDAIRQAKKDGYTSTIDILGCLARRDDIAQAPLPFGWRNKYGLKGWQMVQVKCGQDKNLLKLVRKRFSKVKVQPPR